MGARRGNRGRGGGLVRGTETISSPKTLFFGVFFVKADPTGHRLFLLSSLQRYVGSNRLIFVIFVCFFFFSTKLRLLLLASNCIAGASHLGGKTKRPRNASSSNGVCPTPSGEKAPSSPRRSQHSGEEGAGIFRCVFSSSNAMGFYFRSEFLLPTFLKAALSPPACLLPPPL